MNADVHGSRTVAAALAALLAACAPAAKEEPSGEVDAIAAASWNHGRESFDYVVVGGGTAGSVLARRLSENPRHSVLLLEAGPTISPAVQALRDWPRYTFSLWGIPEVTVAFETEPSPGALNRRTSILLGQGLGGTSGINAGLYGRPLQSDFDDWGVPGWSGADVLPYFLRLEDHDLAAPGDLHGRRGPVHVGLPVQQQTLTGFYLGLAQLSGMRVLADGSDARDVDGLSPSLLANQRQSGMRLDAYSAYVASRGPRPNLVVRTSATVWRVGSDEGDEKDDHSERARISSVIYLQGGTQLVSVKVKREVVLSAGVFHSPKILLQSGIGPAEDLRALHIPVKRNLPVGRNLIARPLVQMLFSGIPGITFPEMDPQQIASDPRLLTVPIEGVVGAQRSRPTLAKPDYIIGLTDVLPPLPPELAGLTSPSLGICLLGVVNSRGRVSLSSADPRSRPKVEPNLLGDPSDAFPLVACLKRLRAMAAAQQELPPPPQGVPFLGQELAPGAALQNDQDLFGYVLATAQYAHHGFGTCKLGDVVDRRLRVRGFRNLRVADASIVPQALRSEPMGTIYMIGEYAAQMILEDSSD